MKGLPVMQPGSKDGKFLMLRSPQEETQQLDFWGRTWTLELLKPGLISGLCLYLLTQGLGQPKSPPRISAVSSIKRPTSHFIIKIKFLKTY